MSSRFALTPQTVILKFINDKDVFIKFYQKKLASRLINDASASDDSESSMITKMKDIYGHTEVSKLVQMFTDMNLSKGTTEKFKEKERANGGSDIDFTVMVLTSNNWPFNAADTEYNLPAEIRPVTDRFYRMYASVHSGRKLKPLWNFSKAEVKTTYLPTKYIFLLNAYQAAILLQFNELDSHSFQDLRNNTALEESILKPQLGLLVKSRVLTQDGDQYDLNMSGSTSNSAKEHAADPRLQIQKAQGQPQPPCARGTKGRVEPGLAGCRGGPQVCLPGDYREIAQVAQGGCHHFWALNRSLTVDDEAPGFDPGGHGADFYQVYAQDPRDQKGYRLLARQRVHYAG